MREQSSIVALYARIRHYVTRNANASTLLLVFVAYCLLTIAFTYPVAFNISSAPAGIKGGDKFEYVWTLWWAKKALIDFRTSPANVTMLYYPYGAYHPLLLSDAFLMLFSLPLVLVGGPVVAYNLFFLVSYALTGFTTYLLCYFVTRHKWCSFLGGVIFAYIPFRSVHGAYGQLNILTTFWVPLYVLFLFRLFDKPGIRNALVCGLFLALSFLSTPLMAAHAAVPVTVLYLVYRLIVDRRRFLSIQLAKALGLASGAALVLIIPVYYPMVSFMIQGRAMYSVRMSALGYSADLLGFVVPFHSKLLAGGPRALQDLVSLLMPGRLWQEHVVYVGLIPLLLASVAVWRMRSRVAFWVVLALVTGILALGPLLRIGGQLVEYSYKGTSSYIVLPGAILTKLPFYEWVRGPGRFSITTALSIAVLASCGLSALVERGLRGATKAGLTSALALLIVLEYTVFFPYPVEEAPVPDFVRTLAEDGEDYGILDVSEQPYNHRGMYYQTVHEHGIVRGHAYRVPREAAPLPRFFAQLVNPEGEIFSYDIVEVLDELGIRYVILHKDLQTAVQEQRAFLAQHLGECAYEDEHVVAFAVPASDNGETGGPRLLLLRERWHPIESIDGIPSRWMVNDGTLHVRVETEGPYQLALVAHPFREPRHLQVFVDEELVEEYHVGGLQSYVTSPFVLKSGEWIPIRFHVPEGCEVPSEVMDGETDGRCLSMLFQQVDILSVQSEM
jgi:hypothetical protein